MYTHTHKLTHSHSHSELFGDANTGINFDRYEDIPVEATGEGCPKNIASFEECEFNEIVWENVKVYTSLTHTHTP